MNKAVEFVQAKVDEFGRRVFGEGNVPDETKLLEKRDREKTIITKEFTSNPFQDDGKLKPNIKYAENYQLGTEEISEEKKETKLAEYQHIETMVERVLFRDRKHPVDRVIINDFNRKSGANLGEVKIVYGPAADEYTRSHHALALVLGTDIFFRNGAYRPETEEGRKILAHELTHVVQNKKREEYRGASREELEREAEAAEKTAEDSEERCREIVFKGKKYKVSERRYKQVMDEVKDRVEYVAEHNTQGLDEEEYLKFLIVYRDMERNGEMLWQK